MNEKQFKATIQAIRDGSISATTGNELHYWATLNQVYEYIISKPDYKQFADEIIDILQSMFKNLPKIN